MCVYGLRLDVESWASGPHFDEPGNSTHGVSFPSWTLSAGPHSVGSCKKLRLNGL
jgi:hypothetical protein